VRKLGFYDLCVLNTFYPSVMLQCIIMKKKVLVFGADLSPQNLICPLKTAQLEILLWISHETAY